MLKKALHLPHDTPNAGLYSKVNDGGLGVPPFFSMVPALYRGCIERLSRSSDSRVARIAEALFQSDPIRITAKERRKQAAITAKQQWYASVDGRGLKGADKAPRTHQWVSDGTTLMRGSNYISALKTRLGVAHTKLRVARGRPAAPVLWATYSRSALCWLPRGP